MTIIAALLMCVAMKGIQAVEFQCRRNVTCLRGVTNKNITQASGRRPSTFFVAPSPPPTPDPGVLAFECTKEGFVYNPRDCRKFFSCMNSGQLGSLVAYEFTCPSGTLFNSEREACDSPENVVCPAGSAGSSSSRPRATTTTTTTSTTTEPPTTTTTEEPVMIALIKAQCRRKVTCRCGVTDKNITLSTTCEPSSSFVCSRLSTCKTCQEGSDVCTTCPDQREGPLCSPSSWLPVPPRLPVPECPIMESPKRGSVQCLTSSEQRTCTGKCLPGFAFASGDEKEITLTCREGDWTPLASFPECTFLPEKNGCRDPGFISNGFRRLPDGSEASARRTFREGQSVVYGCLSEEYDLEGFPLLTCKGDGTWSRSLPTCIKFIPDEPAEVMCCDNPGLVMNGKVEYIPPANRGSCDAGSSPDYLADEFPEQSVMKYSCEDGYRLEGKANLVCQSGGIWSEDTPPTCVPDCGRSFMLTEERGVNGTKTLSGDWPWVVSISIDDRFICGGAVINIHTVITAAHCLMPRRPLTLRFGKHKFQIGEDDDEVLVARSFRIIVHPDYSNRTLDSDIGLIIFRPRIRYSPRVQPICLPTLESTYRNMEPGTKGFVSGWGLTELGNVPASMMMVSMPVVSNEQCVDAYRDRNLVITRNMFCAGYEDARQTVCDGDSGSPFVFYNRRIKRYTLEGLVSFGVKGQCGHDGNNYALFTKVFRFLEWIHRNWE